MTAYMVVCSVGTEVVRVDYSKLGHPRNVHADGSFCEHSGGVSIEERPAAPDCTCPAATGECPHCGSQRDQEHKDRCHRAAVGDVQVWSPEPEPAPGGGRNA